MRRLLGCTVSMMMVCFSITGVHAQIFPGLQGEDLEQALRDTYTPTILLDDTQLRDTLYAVVFLQDDSVHCVYSDYARHLPAGVDPSQHLFDNGSNATSMNLEHGWPQSKGAGDGTQGNRNMYHLFPSRMVINSVRADFPFNDVVDQHTQNWYYLDKVMNTIPVSNIDNYSEYASGHFEPREDFKGDLARAMFYFWTIYRNDAEQADPDFFEIQRADLCRWHIEDPVDDFELVRDARIASYQSDLNNPFIHDCTLAARTYCPELSDCATVSSHDPSVREAIFEVDIQSGRIRIVSELPGLWTVRIFDVTGSEILNGRLQTDSWMSLPTLTPGIYFLTGDQGSLQISQKVFVP